MKKNHDKKAISTKYIVLLISMISILIIKSFSFLPFSSLFSQVFAISPSFVRQETLAAPGDWSLWKVPYNIIDVTTHDDHIIPIEPAKNISQCKEGNKFVSPSINSVSYISNGKTFNSTVWLTSPFKEPPITDTLEPYQKQLEIKISNLTALHANNLKDYSNNITENAGLYAAIQNKEIQLELNSTTATIGSNIPAYELIYTNKTNNLSLREMQFLAIKNGKGYDITFSVLSTKYDQYLRTDIQPMINSLRIGQEEIISKNNGNTASKNQYHDIGQFLLTYSHHGIKIQYPVNWQVKENENIQDKSITLSFVSPPTDTLYPYDQSPSWHEVTFGMAIAIDTIQHPGVTDYRVTYNRTNINGIWTWTRQVSEVSANDETRTLEEEHKGQNNYTSFYDQRGEPYVLFSFDLGKINFPQQYRVAFDIIDYFVIKHRLCRLLDITNWVVVPPPEFTMSTTNSSGPIKLRPGEEKDVELLLKGNTHLPSQAFLTTPYTNNNNNNQGNDNKVIDASFTSNKTSIAPYGSGISTLHLKVSDIAAKPYPYTVTIPMTANISFPTTIKNREGEIFNNSKSISLLLPSNLTLTILPPYSLGDQFNNFVKDWITPVTGMWTFLAGIATVLTPLIIRIYNKKRRREKGL